MITGFMFLALGVPASAACGKLWAKKARLGNEDWHGAVAALLPPYGAFCALNLLMKG